MIRKLLAVLLSFMLVFSIPLTAMASGVTITQQGEVAKGEEIVFEVRLAEELTAMSGMVYIEFDPNVLVVVSHQWHLTNALITDFDTATGLATFVCSSVITIGDLLLTVTFKVKDTAEYGDASVKVTTNFNESGNPADGEKENTEGDVYVSCMNHIPGAAATCTTDQVCTVCQYVLTPALGHTYEDIYANDETHHWLICTVAGCNFANEAEKTEHSATGANVATCKDQAICDACGVAHGSLNATNHAGGTTIVNAAEPDHKAQIAGYTGDTKCLGCNEIIAYGQPIEPGAHTPADVWSNDETHHWKECNVVGCGVVIDGSKAAHTSTGTNVATCQKQAVCDVCGVSYGSVEEHKYTAEDKKPEALKAAGNCRDNAVYYYSCSVCGLAENDDTHTFLGDKVATAHVGGTTIVNATEANHKEQLDGYTGDTKCLGCNEIIAYGQAIPAGAHNPANTWTTDETHHWKECSVVGCGVVIDGSKTAHTSTGANVATCQKQAVCDVCGVSYGTVANHDFADTLSKDATGHWYDCQTAGCTEKDSFVQHTPDHDGGATEEYPIKCTVCQYEIEAQLVHTHVFDKEVADELYLASKATCTDSAKYYKSCKCGEKGTDTFTSGEKLGHTEGTVWEKDATGHWHTCTVAGCGVVIDTTKTAHTPDREAATETDPIKCTVCGYEIAPVVPHSHNHGTEWESDSDNHWNECVCGDKANAAAHKDENTDGKCDICEYNVPVSGPSNPSTGDSSMIFLWMLLLCVGGLGMVAIATYRKKNMC